MKLTEKQGIILIFLNESFKRREENFWQSTKQEQFGKTMVEI